MSKKAQKQNMLSRIFKNNQPPAESTKVDLSSPVPRSQEEINKAYSQVCTEIGDKTVKKQGLDQELSQLFKYVESLGSELAARQKLDKQAADLAAQAQSSNTQDISGQSQSIEAAL